MGVLDGVHVPHGEKGISGDFSTPWFQWRSFAYAHASHLLIDFNDLYDLYDVFPRKDVRLGVLLIYLSI